MGEMSTGWGQNPVQFPETPGPEPLWASHTQLHIAPFQMQAQIYGKSDIYHSGRLGKQLLYERKPRPAPRGPGGSPRQSLVGPNLGHSNRCSSLASPCFLRWPCLASPAVPGSSSAAQLGLAPLGPALGLWRPVVRAWPPFLSSLLLAWGPSRPSSFGCLREHVCGERRRQGHQGTGTSPRFPAAPTPATYPHQAPLPPPGGNTQLRPPLPPAGQPPLSLGRHQDPQHRYPHRPLPVPASCLPGSSSWKGVAVRVAACTRDPASPAQPTATHLCASRCSRLRWTFWACWSCLWALSRSFSSLAARMACSSSSVLCTEEEETCHHDPSVSGVTPLRGPQTPSRVVRSPVLTETVEQHVPLPHAFLDFDELQRHPRPNLQRRGEESALPQGWELPEVTSATGPAPGLGLTSVSRTALCWARMLPRPATAWGSSVMLCSPSGSASLSDSPAPLCRGHSKVSRGSQAPGTAPGSQDCNELPPSALLTWPTAR